MDPIGLAMISLHGAIVEEVDRDRREHLMNAYDCAGRGDWDDAFECLVAVVESYQDPVEQLVTLCANSRA